MFNLTHGRVGRHMRELTNEPGLEVERWLSPEMVSKALDRCRVEYRDRVFNPLVTLWAFCWQVMAAGGSCSEAVARVLAWREKHGLSPCSMNTGSYCGARQRLSLDVIQTLMKDMAEALHSQVAESSLWKRRAVKIVDGTTMTMLDTPANQKRYPQARTQKPGLGWPIARLVVVFSLHAGAVLDMAVGPYSGKKSGENSLFRRLLGHIRPNEVVLADRYFSGYADVALIAERQADVVVNKHQHRKTDLTRARRLGKDDHQVVWRKPAQCGGVEREVFDRLPDEMTLREVTVNIDAKGFRTRRITLITTLLDPQEYSPADLAALYRRRWEAELNLRSLKSTMNMDVLGCKSPEMVNKTLWMYMLAYNLVRMMMVQAGEVHGCDPCRLSFASTLHVLRQFQAAGLLDASHAPVILRAIAQTRVPERPDRVEPRAVKRRAKPHKHLTQPREQARMQLVCQR